MRAKDNMRTAAEVLVDQLLIHGVQHAFCVPGESYLAVLDAFHDRDLAVTVCRQEGGACMMAEAVGKVTGRPGVCFVTRGPGATNASAGIHIAKQDSTPLVMFVGQVGRDMREREAFQELDYRAVFGSMAKWATEIDDPARVPEIVSRAFYTAANGRPGPVVVAIPEDMLVERVAVPDAPPFALVETSPGQTEMAKFAQMLSAAHAPIMLLGGSRWSQAASDGIGRFAEKYSLPVATTFRRGSLFDQLHPCYAGDLGIGPNPKLLERIKSADLVIMVGGRLGELPSQSYTLFDIPRPQMPFIHVHPGAEELGRVYSPHLAINATPTAFAAALDHLELKEAKGSDAQAAHSSFLEWTDKPTDQPGGVNFGAVMVWLREYLAAQCHPLQRRGQLRVVDPSLLPFPPVRQPCRTGVGLDGIRRAGSGGDEAASSRPSGHLPRRRRRLPDEWPGICNCRTIWRAGHHHHRRQRHVRHHPHASGARISGPHFRNRIA